MHGFEKGQFGPRMLLNDKRGETGGGGVACCRLEEVGSWVSVRERDHLQDLDTEGGILKWILKK